jgi:hypothetical protein
MARGAANKAGKLAVRQIYDIPNAVHGRWVCWKIANIKIFDGEFIELRILDFDTCWP